MTDKNDYLKDNPFCYRTTKDNKVFISCENRIVMTLKGKKADDFLRKIQVLEDFEAQLIMAKITGNFKRGNER